MKARKIFYELRSNPLDFLKVRFVGHLFERQTDKRLACSVSLLNQHDEQPPFNGPVHLDVIFYVPAIDATDLITPFVKLIENVGRGSIYGPRFCIVSLCVERKVDKNPRTEFTITEL